MVFHTLHGWSHIHTFISPARLLSGTQWEIGSWSSPKVKLIFDPLNGGLGQHGAHLARGFQHCAD